MQNRWPVGFGHLGTRLYVAMLRVHLGAHAKQLAVFFFTKKFGQWVGRSPSCSRIVLIRFEANKGSPETMSTQMPSCLLSQYSFCKVFIHPSHLLAWHSGWSIFVDPFCIPFVSLLSAICLRKRVCRPINEVNTRAIFALGFNGFTNFT